jgi:hypothetical protein
MVKLGKCIPIALAVALLLTVGCRVKPESAPLERYAEEMRADIRADLPQSSDTVKVTLLVTADKALAHQYKIGIETDDGVVWSDETLSAETLTYVESSVVSYKYYKTVYMNFSKTEFFNMYRSKIAALITDRQELQTSLTKLQADFAALTKGKTTTFGVPGHEPLTAKEASLQTKIDDLEAKLQATSEDNIGYTLTPYINAQIERID